jgi:hypothetical protein
MMPSTPEDYSRIPVVGILFGVIVLEALLY